LRRNSVKRIVTSNT
jgi:hypothetical protein